MIAIERVLTRKQTYCDVDVDSKKRLLEMMAQLMHEVIENADAQTIYEALLERERLGSTAVGGGIALPHARIESLNEPAAIFMRLKNGIDFDAEDNQPVDLIFGLVVPKDSNEQYLNILAQLASRFRDSKLLTELRHCDDADKIYRLLVYEDGTENSHSRHSS